MFIHPVDIVRAMATILFKSKKLRKLKETKEDLEETKGEKYKKKIIIIL